MASETPAAVASSPPPLRDQSPSNLSSPLSEVEDKDSDPDEMDLDASARISGTPEPPQDAATAADAPRSGANTATGSELSEMDVNDSEAETERLYDTPPKNKPSREIVNGARTADHSPSKLQYQVRPPAEDDNGSDGEPLSDADDYVSLSSSGAGITRGSQSPSPAQQKAARAGAKAAAEQTPEEGSSADSRKRKRASAAEQSELEQPLRKRTGSVGTVDREASADDAVVEDEAPPPASADTNKDEAAESIEQPAADAGEPAKPRRSSARKRKSPDEGAGSDEPAHDDGETATADGDAAQEEEQPEADVDEEAEIAHRNEEEQRKKAAWEELTAIEKQFGSFRERLYQERLDQLNQEEAMLTGDNPTHPQYLAMLRCIDERREERIRVSKLELQLNTGVLRRRAVGERAQIMSQYCQSVRESREKALDALGKEWYEIQHERRRFANNIPDFGIRFPAGRAQTLRQSAAYNKEVSILSGFAKYKGFPAAPAIPGASEEQLDEDFDHIKRAKRSSLPPASSTPLHSEPAPSLPFGHSLGPAGEQFLEQTPWANPNHPAHHAPKHLHPDPSAAGTPTPSNPGHRRQARQPVPSSGVHAAASALVNGDSALSHKPGDSVLSHKPGDSALSHKPFSPAQGARKVPPETGLKREALLQAS